MIDVTIPLSTPDPRAVAYLEKLQSIYTQKNYAAQEASICLPGDQSMLKAIEQVREGLGQKLKAVLVIGIGGSNLGTRAIYEAMGEAMLPLFFLDTCDAWTMNQVLKSLRSLNISSWNELALLCVSKSGTTTETIANFSAIVLQLTEWLGTPEQSSIVIIADTGTAAEELAKQSGYSFLSIPQQVGGRFSVLSSVGLLPLVLCGVPIASLLHGAQAQLEEDCSSTSKAALYASFLLNELAQGKNIHDFFLFEPRLESLGKWLRQLYAESLGKDRKGMLPTVSIGSNDLHSVVQYYFGGKIELVTSFISVSGGQDFPTSDLGVSLVKGIQGKSLNSIKEAILEAVKTTYTHKKIPYASMQFSEISAATLGAFLQFHMTTVMILGQLMEVNTFNQPDVEAYKTELRAQLDSR
ncbi:hypothetical protein KBD71_01290 [Candidatus Woesebacteria bacterium]|nr:hypothetical protein [Candidatus Woesebacteria bacterium]